MKSIQRILSLRFWVLLLIVICFAGLKSPQALENGIGRTPAMGWNPWNTFLRWPTLDLLKEVMDSMVTNGMRDAGYIYMTADGGPFMYGPDSGLQEFVDYGHSRGFKMGFYVGNARGKEDSIVKSWAKIGFDYLKHDDYKTPWSDPTYIRMRDALKKCGRPVYYTIHPSDFAPRPDTICNAQRVGNDISWKENELNWGGTKDNGHGVIGEVMLSRIRDTLARPGYFNDMDMMGVGMPKNLTTEEARTHFNLWCIMASLLLEGSDVRKIAKDRLEILLNRELIAINQDSLGEQGRVVWSRYTSTDSIEVLSKKLQDGSRAVMLLNRHGATKNISVKMSDLGLTGTVHVRDLWKHANLPDAKDSLTIMSIQPHGSAMLKISKNPIAHSIGLQKNRGLQAIPGRLFNTRIQSHIQLSPIHSGLKIYNLQGALLWEMQQSVLSQGSVISMPASLKQVGMVIVKFTNFDQDGKF